MPVDISSPHTWGCPQIFYIFGAGRILFPTHVGVSLQGTFTRGQYFALPHTRGGVPLENAHFLSELDSSPHTWGCPSIEFHTSKTTLASLPHTRGGVPASPSTLDWKVFSSPHTWGCPHENSSKYRLLPLFPTHVGVSLQLLLRVWTLWSLPHTRGGVPIISVQKGGSKNSSPHTWGCPINRLPIIIDVALFPTHVGVSLAKAQVEHQGPSLPHTRGGVPYPIASACSLRISSPHTWGCPPPPGCNCFEPRLFPTHVGVSRCISRPVPRGTSLPHTRGGVPTRHLHPLT